MDPATIGASVVALLTPLVKESAQEFAGAAGDVVKAKVHAIRDRLKEKFAGDGYATGTLERFETRPEVHGPPLQEAVTEAVQDDPELAEELSSAIEEIERAGPTISVVQRMKRARDVTGVVADRVVDGDVSVVQEMDDAERVVGARLGSVGGSSTGSDDEEE